MKIDFWTSTEYGGFLAELMAEMNDAGLETRQRFLISESSYRSAKSKPARLWLRLRQYAIYPIYLCGSLLWGRVKSGLKGKRKIGQGEVDYDGDNDFDNDYPDVVVVCTNTFYAPWLATFCHKRVVHLV